MEYLECNECCKDKCESKGPLQRKVHYPKNIVEVDGSFATDFSVNWVELWPCKTTGRWAVALPQVPSAGQHGAVPLQAPPVVCIMHVTLHSSFVGRAQSGLKFAANDCNAQTQHIQKQNKIVTNAGNYYPRFLGGEGEEGVVILPVIWLVSLTKEFLSYGPDSVSA